MTSYTLSHLTVLFFMEKHRTRSSEAISNREITSFANETHLSFKKNRSASVEKKQKNLFVSQTKDNPVRPFFKLIYRRHTAMVNFNLSIV